jgi:YD repeat-containing protein
LDNGPGCPQPVGEPIDPLRGLSEQYTEDWSSGGPNPLTIGRFYYKNDGFNSSANNSSAFGYGWRPSFQAMLAASDASFTNVVVTIPCGRELLFILTGGTFQPAYVDAATGNYVAGAKGMAETLIDTGTKLELTTNDGVIYAFDKTSSRLVQVRKRGGYIQTPTYDADGKLIGLQDNLGRSAVFQHDNQGRVTSVTVDSLTVVVYAYSSIVDPSIYAGLPLPIPPDLVMSAAVLSNVSYPSIDCVP